MGRNETFHDHDLFQVDNAKGLTRRNMVETFVPTDSFWRLLSSRNHLVLGSRGSGKTALARMVSHSHLSLFSASNKRARSIIESKSFIGIYSPTSLGWVGGLKNKPWFSEQEAELFFQWRLNLSTCQSFVDTLRSCLDTYIENKGERARVERAICADISSMWSDKSIECSTTTELVKYLKQLEREKQTQTGRQRVFRDTQAPEQSVGPVFDTELLSPLRSAIDVVSEKLNFSDETSWLLCLDEAEFLEPIHQRILNSHLRAHSGNLFFNITTLPYAHTNETNTRVPLDSGHDYDIIYIDRDPVMWAGQGSKEGMSFAIQLFELRLKGSRSKYQGLKLPSMLGRSELLDPLPSDWSEHSDNMVRLKKYANIATIQRAERDMHKGGIFRDAISRKMQGALLLRDRVEHTTGGKKLDIYSGLTMLIRCGDSNPRRMIALFKYMLTALQQQPQNRRKESHGLIDIPLVSREDQTTCLVERSKRELDKVKAESHVGPETWQMLVMIGSHLHRLLHKEPLGTDQKYSVSIDNRVTDREWELVKKAVHLGLLFPNVSTNNPDQMPEREGNFHLAYILAPHFRLLPRRGKSITLSSVIRQDQALDEQTTMNLL